MLWINFLHLYQPANASVHTIKEATKLSYWRLVRALEENPKIKFTLNITGCLLLRWDELGFSDLIKRINNLIKKGQIELTGSAAYHPILPLIPSEEIKRQIEENEFILKRYLSKEIKLRGFFLPEMAYSKQAAKIIKKMGYEWLILDEMAYSGKLNQADLNKVYLDYASGLKIIFRCRALSKNYVPDKLSRIIKDGGDNGKIFITATDGELYGLRHKDPTGEFEELLKYKNLTTATISEFISKSKKLEKIKLLASNWETTADDLNKKLPYALWFDKRNYLQLKLWELANLAYKTVVKNKKDKNYYWACWHLVRGLSSCTFWWASGKDLGPFSPISWGPDEVIRGADDLIRSIRTLANIKTLKNKIKGEKIYLRIYQMIWQKHWIYYWKK
ncbi:hypothetical protein COX67_02295 [Candidatus Falkowbacteria bacterium CG_4_10_14_0_2_um_filter_36_22]|nr:MAG: hypothetical protein COZ73_04945 [Candidatus Falkowbacteria bacterium CG_4_8_14_3_um_filter_36_11]PJA10958.1 MAG: hypothetical protein COX67_02295 [Candidatus Falkowbacteria bacterium CG_4_10_14_0_2_um_filter_36_22]